jgi:hypothetical protein
MDSSSSSSSRASQLYGANSSGTSSTSGSSQGVAIKGQVGPVAAALPPVAARFVEFAGALEAVLRTVTLAVQSSTLHTAQVPTDFIELLAAALLPQPDLLNTHSGVLQQMGLRGSVMLAQEQRQLYSLLSTVLKLGGCGSWEGQSC